MTFLRLRILIVAVVLSHAWSIGLNGQDKKNDSVRSKTAVSFETRDGVRIAASFFRAKSDAEDLNTNIRPALILLHGSNRTKERWSEIGFVKRLLPENYHMLAIDIRGRGESGIGDSDELRRNPGLGIYDIEAAMNWVTKQPGVDKDRIALVGSSYGANLVIAGCLTQPWKIQTVVCFSPTAASYRMKEAFAGENKIRSGFFVAGRQEPKRYDVVETAARLMADTEGPSIVQLHNDPAHALTIWYHHPETRDQVVDWLRAQLK